MPYGSSDESGLKRVTSKEKTTQRQAYSGTETRKKAGPAVGNHGSPNPVKGGGINRATSGQK